MMRFERGCEQQYTVIELNYSRIFISFLHRIHIKSLVGPRILPNRLYPRPYCSLRRAASHASWIWIMKLVRCPTQSDCDCSIFALFVSLSLAGIGILELKCLQIWSRTPSAYASIKLHLIFNWTCCCKCQRQDPRQMKYVVSRSP